MTYISNRSNRGATEGRSNTGTGYSAGGGVSRGQYATVKPGYRINFFTDSAGRYMVGPSGGNRGQSAPPARESGEPVGITTGLSENGFIQVDWVNSWWQSGFPKGERKTENRTSWVKADSVNVSTTYTEPGTTPAPTNDIYEGDPPPTGIDTTTLGIIAVGAALVFGRKKGRKK